MSFADIVSTKNVNLQILPTQKSHHTMSNTSSLFEGKHDL